ncbi:MAG: hypothetical protein IKS96_03310 [Fibrobacter sp.]|nr:hypothetical protein [Fibrobacter sp.]
MSKLLWLFYFLLTLAIFLLTIFICSDKFDFITGIASSIVGSLLVGLLFPQYATQKDKETTILWAKESIRTSLNSLHDWLSSCSTVLDGYPQNVSNTQLYKKMNTNLKSSLRALTSLEQMKVEGENENEKK